MVNATTTSGAKTNSLAMDTQLSIVKVSIPVHGISRYFHCFLRWLSYYNDGHRLIKRHCVKQTSKLDHVIKLEP